MTTTLSTLMESTLIEKALNFSLVDCVILLVCSFLLGSLVAWTYKKTYTGVMYASTFGITLVSMTMVSSLVLMLVSSNVVLTLGTVGALSIIRFRTAIKEPMDVMFMFWAVACGIVIGAGMIGMALIGSILIALVLILLTGRHQIGAVPYVLVVRCSDTETERRVMDQVRGNVRKLQIKNKTVTPQGVELTLDVRLTNEDAGFVNTLGTMEGVSNAALVTYNGEYIS